MENIKIKGLYPAAICPFTKSNEVDIEGFKSNLKVLIDAGCAGVCVNGSTGEAVNLSREERKEVIKAAKEIAPDGFLIIAGTGAPTTKDAVQQTADAKEAGADIALVLTPFNCIPNKQGLIKHYEEVAKVDIPIIMYNLPEHTGCEIDLETLEYLSNKKSFVGLKESSGDLAYLTKAIEKTPDDFEVLCGADDKVFLAACLGVNAYILALGNLAPGKIINMLSLINEGNLFEARKINSKFLTLSEIILASENFPAPVKEASGILGLKSSEPRMPTIALDKKESDIIKEALKEADLL